MFLNFTDTEFSWKFDNNEYTFAPKQQVYMEDFKAEHFAKHLVDREMNRLGKMLNDGTRAALIAKALPTASVAAPVEPIIEPEDEPSEEKMIEKIEEPKAEGKKRFCDKCDSKGRFHKTGCPMREKKEVEFEGSNN